MAHWRQSGAKAGRAITNTTSPAGTNPLPGMRVVLAHISDAALQSVAAYDVSKFGTVALTEVLAMESAAEGSTVGASVLVPGTVHTRKRHQRPPGGRVGWGAGPRPLCRAWPNAYPQTARKPADRSERTTPDDRSLRGPRRSP